MSHMSTPAAAPALGLGANWRQFWLLVLINAIVGAMVGLERTILVSIPGEEFGLTGTTVALSFIVVFGLSKAVTNFFAGTLSERIGRKKVLLLGWLFGLPVPLLIIWAPTWTWVLVANVFLGINQGLAWSTAVIMKIDLVGPRQRGLAMGLNEFAGYLAQAGAAVVSGYVADLYGLRPTPFYLGIGLAVVGLMLTLLLVRDTSGHARLEAMQRPATADPPSLWKVIRLATWQHPALSSSTQAGLVNNLNDGLAWGLFPLFFASAGLSLSNLSLVVSVYPASWALGQLWTGALSDRWGRKWMIAWGMWIQGLALVLLVPASSVWQWTICLLFMGIGTAMVYPTLLASVGDVAHPGWRAQAIGVYRFWRDSGYAVGALAAGLLADLIHIPAAIIVVGLLTLASGAVVAIRMPETRPRA